MDNDGFITIREAADLLGVSTRTVRRAIGRHPTWSTHLDNSRSASPVRVIARKDVLAYAGEHGVRDRGSDGRRDTTALVSRDRLSRASAAGLAGALNRLAEATRASSAAAQRRDRLQVALALAFGLPVLVGVAILAWRLVAMLEGI